MIRNSNMPYTPTAPPHFGYILPDRPRQTARSHGDHSTAHASMVYPPLPRSRDGSVMHCRRSHCHPRQICLSILDIRRGVTNAGLRHTVIIPQTIIQLDLRVLPGSIWHLTTRTEGVPVLEDNVCRGGLKARFELVRHVALDYK